jgi:putative flippase GtrA
MEIWWSLDSICTPLVGMVNSIVHIIDFLHRTCSPWMPKLTFRYAICGAFNTLIGLTVYFIGIQFLFTGSAVNMYLLVFKPHVAALILSGLVSFSLGFLLNKFIVFTGSELRGRIQLFRYGLTFCINLVLNYFMLRLLVEMLVWDPFVSQVVTTGIVIAAGYLMQKYFSFKV